MYISPEEDIPSSRNIQSTKTLTCSMQKIYGNLIQNICMYDMYQSPVVEYSLCNGVPCQFANYIGSISNSTLTNLREFMGKQSEIPFHHYLDEMQLHICPAHFRHILKYFADQMISVPSLGGKSVYALLRNDTRCKDVHTCTHTQMDG